MLPRQQIPPALGLVMQLTLVLPRQKTGTFLLP
jgi:hypothetical protein